MKNILLAVSVLVATNCKAQDRLLLGNSNCGTWQYDRTDTSKWEYEEVHCTCCENSKWAYDTWRKDMSNDFYLIACECGCNPASTYVQKRISKTTGDIQVRYAYEHYNVIKGSRTQTISTGTLLISK